MVPRARSSAIANAGPKSWTTIDHAVTAAIAPSGHTETCHRRVRSRSSRPNAT